MEFGNSQADCRPHGHVEAGFPTRKKPVVIETPQGDMIGIRHMMILSLAYDHRVVDGALGGMYLKRLAELLENFDTNRNI